MTSCELGIKGKKSPRENFLGKAGHQNRQKKGIESERRGERERINGRR